MNLKILFVDVENPQVKKLFESAEVQNVSSATHLFYFSQNNLPHLIVLDRVNCAEIEALRRNDLFISIPILILQESFSDEKELYPISNFPRILLCNICAAKTELFQSRLKLIAEKKAENLPARTGAIVKYAIYFINQNVGEKITRSMLADKLGVADDYLTRIFNREINLSLWDYVNLFRIYNASKLLVQTDDNIYQIAKKSGFNDASYFNRLYKREFGLTPKQFRKSGMNAVLSNVK